MALIGLKNNGIALLFINNNRFKNKNESFPLKTIMN